VAYRNINAAKLEVTVPNFVKLFYKKYIDLLVWLGAEPPSQIERPLSAKKDTEAGLNEVSKGMPSEFNGDEMVTEEDLPEWLKERPEDEIGL
jgi:hypothetical protein